MASESLKLLGILDGNRGDAADVDYDDAVGNIRIFDIFSEETFEIVSFTDSPATSLSSKTGEKKLAASV